MLVLTRKVNEQIVIQVGEETIYVKVVEVGRDRVRLGIVAPPHVPVHREEVFQRIAEGTQDLASVG